MIALVFLVLGGAALLRTPDVPAVWIVVGLCSLVAGWQARTAALRYFEAQESRD